MYSYCGGGGAGGGSRVANRPDQGSRESVRINVIEEFNNYY